MTSTSRVRRVRHVVSAFVLFTLTSTLPAQVASPEQHEPLIVTASRGEQSVFDTPASVEALFSADLLRRSYRTVPAMLRDVPGVMVQETSVSQGSPYIRGFTGYHNLLLIDGIRLNNSVFRSGPNQYWSTIDSLSIDRVEVAKGPGSVLYGSDAIGGTVQVFTRDPWTDGPGFTQGASTYLRFTSADRSTQARGEVSLGLAHEDGSHTSLLVGGDRKIFDDAEGGSGTGLMPYTAYDEWALDAKMIHRFDEHSRLVVAHQKLRQNDAPRTHRTMFAKPWRGTTIGSDLAHEYDQDRALSYLQYHAEDLGGAIDAVHASASVQSQKEDRYRLRSGNRIDNQGFDVDTYGLWLQLESDTDVGHLTYGFEWYRDRVDSFLERNTPGATDWIQGPVADDAIYDLAALFLQDHFEIDRGFDVTFGGRVNYAAADAGSVLDPATSTQIAIDDRWSDVVFSARARYEIVPDEIAVFGGISQGFRAPNLSDLSRFDSARTNEFETPSPGLNSEHTLTYEVGVKVERADWSAQSSWFFTDVRDLIQRFPTGTTLPSGEVEITKGNVGDGALWGVEVGGAVRICDCATIFGNATFMEGRVDNHTTSLTTTSSEYFTRLMPLTAQVGARWENSHDHNFWAETLVRFAGDADKLSFADASDTSRIPPGGTPGYAVWDLGAGWAVRDDTTLNLRVENLTDVDYRIHGSGTNMPGRSFVMLMESRF